MPERLDVLKTWKLFIGGAFPRSESGRSDVLHGAHGEPIAHLCRASRKDLRQAVEAATSAAGGWAARTAYNRGQILYRMAEMMEGRHAEFVATIRHCTGDSAAAAKKEVNRAIDRVVAFAGWTDKFAQILGCHNPVAGPYYNFTVPEPTGVVGIVAPDAPSLLGVVSLLMPVICAGNTSVVVVGHKFPLPALLLGEVCATSDVPAGVINILSGRRAELLEPLATHRGIDAVNAANLRRPERTMLRAESADNLKRIHHARVREDDWSDDRLDAPWTIEPFVEMKTIWHPSAAR